MGYEANRVLELECDKIVIGCRKNILYNQKLIIPFIISTLILVFLSFDILVCNGFNVRRVFSGNANYNFSFIRVIIYLFVLAAIFIFRKKLLGKLNEYECFTKTKKALFIGFIIVAVLIFCSYAFVEKAVTNNITSIQLGSIAITLLLGMLAVFLVGNNTAFNVLVIGLTCAFVFPFFTIMFHGVDEYSHFLSSYNVLIGNVLNPQNNARVATVFSNIPVGTSFKQVFAILQVPVNYSNQVVLQNAPGLFPTNYPSIFYFPSALGLLVARTLHLNVAFTLFSGRLFNMLTYVSLSYLTIKKLPFAKNLFLVFLFTPMLLLLSSTYSIDGIGMVFILYYAAYCFDLAYRTPRIKVRDYVFMLIALILAIIFKSFAYAPIILLTLFVPLKKYITKPKIIRIIKIGFFALLVLAVCYLFYKFSTYPAGSGDPRGGANVDVAKQFKNIVAHPGAFMVVLARTFFERLMDPGWLTYLIQNYFFGKGTCLLLPLLCFWTYVAVTDNSYGELSFKGRLNEKTILFIYVAASTFLVFLGMYLTFTPVGSILINGTQPRYLYPILPFAFLLLMSKKVSFKITDYTMKISSVVIFFLVVAQIFMIMHQP